MLLPSTDGLEIRPGVTLIGEPSPVPGTDTLRCLANVEGCLCVVELRIKFGAGVAPGDGTTPEVEVEVEVEG
jgi:hypothetical protein